jgi:serine/threonine protein kinase
MFHACPGCAEKVGEFDPACRRCGHALVSAGGPTIEDRTPPLAEGARLGRYRVTGLLGRGAMGEVYRAEDVELGRALALKVLNAELVGDRISRARFVREARVLCRLQHPSVGVVFDVGEMEGRPFIVMELHDGESLARVLEAGPLPLGEALRVAREIAGALAAIHEAGVVHRDLKPANVMLRSDGGVRVLDFGLARVEHAGGDEALTHQGQLVGTVAYMAPERLQGAPAAPASDLWALGIVLVEMLTGAVPFACARDVLTRPLPQLALLDGQAPLALAELVSALLEKRADARMASAKEAEAALDALASAAPVAEALEAGTLIDERFELVHEIGRGGMGIVWKAVDRACGEEVAVKVLAADLLLSPRAARRFANEIAAAARIESRHVLAPIDHGSWRGQPYFTMRKVCGETLEARLAREGRFETAELLRLAEQLAHAIDAAHDAGVVHCDLKPANVVLEGDGAWDAQVVDFGVARPLDAEALGSAAGTAIGTPAYMSPEVAEGSRPTEAADLWALAVILFEAATGERPFRAATPGKLLSEVHLHARPRPSQRAPSLPRAFDALWLRATAADPAQRYASAAEMVAELRIALHGPGLAPRSGSRVRGAAIAAGVAALALAALALGRSDATALREPARALAADSQRAQPRPPEAPPPAVPAAEPSRTPPPVPALAASRRAPRPGFEDMLESWK